MGSESGISIGDELLRKSEPSIDMIHIELGDLRASDGGGAGQEDCRPGTTMINYCQDGIITLVAR